MSNCDLQDCCMLRRHSQWSDTHVASTEEKKEVLTTLAVRTNPEVQGLPVVAEDPADGQAFEAANPSNHLVWPMPEPQSEQQESHGDRELILVTDWTHA